MAGHNRLCHLPDLQAVYRQDGIGVQILKYCFGVLFWGTEGGRGSRALALRTACGQFLNPGSYADSFARRLTFRLQQTQLTGTRNRFGAPLDLQLVKDISIVSFDSTQGEEKLLAGLAIRESLGHES